MGLSKCVLLFVFVGCSSSGGYPTPKLRITNKPASVSYKILNWVNLPEREIPRSTWGVISERPAADNPYFLPVVEERPHKVRVLWDTKYVRLALWKPRSELLKSLAKEMTISVEGGQTELRALVGTRGEVEAGVMSLEDFGLKIEKVDGVRGMLSLVVSTTQRPTRRSMAGFLGGASVYATDGNGKDKHIGRGLRFLAAKQVATSRAKNYWVKNDGFIRGAFYTAPGPLSVWGRGIAGAGTSHPNVEAGTCLYSQEGELIGMTLAALSCEVEEGGMIASCFPGRVPEDVRILDDSGSKQSCATTEQANAIAKDSFRHNHSI